MVRHCHLELVEEQDNIRNKNKPSIDLLCIFLSAYLVWPLATSNI